MKTSTIKLKLVLSIGVVLMLSILVGCKIESTNSITFWVFYNETQCSDPWGTYDLMDNEKKRVITAYFKNKGVEILKIKFNKNNIHPACALCPCTTGTIILSEIKKEHLLVMKEDGFAQY
jgi:hypothetical protein